MIASKKNACRSPSSRVTYSRQVDSYICSTPKTTTEDNQAGRKSYFPFCGSLSKSFGRTCTRVYVSSPQALTYVPGKTFDVAHHNRLCIRLISIKGRHADASNCLCCGTCGAESHEAFCPSCRQWDSFLGAQGDSTLACRSAQCCGGGKSQKVGTRFFQVYCEVRQWGILIYFFF